MHLMAEASLQQTLKQTGSSATATNGGHTAMAGCKDDAFDRGHISFWFTKKRSACYDLPRQYTHLTVCLHIMNMKLPGSDHEDNKCMIEAYLTYGNLDHNPQHGSAHYRQVLLLLQNLLRYELGAVNPKLCPDIAKRGLYIAHIIRSSSASQETVFRLCFIVSTAIV